MRKTACEFKSSFLSTKSFFIKKGVIDVYQNITNINEFRKLNKVWSDKAAEKYGTTGMLFEEINKSGKDGKVYYQASPNTELFNKIDEARKAKLPGEQLSLDLNQVSTEGTPDKSLDSSIVKFLSSIGVHINTLDEIKVLDKDGNEISIVAKADLLRGIIDVAKGKRGVDTLSEEAAHFLVELLGDSHPLVKQMIENIDQFGVYQEVLNEYGELEAYKGNDRKLRKEAVGKLIAQILTGTYVKEEPKIGWFNNLLNSLFDWIKSKFGGDKAKSVNDAIAAYEKAANMILTNETSELMTLDNLRKEYEGRESEEMYQTSNEDDAARDHAIEVLSKDKVIKESNSYKLVTTLEKVKARVTDTIKRMNFEIYHRYDRGDKRSKNEAKMGVIIHAAMQYIFNERAADRNPKLSELRKAVGDIVRQSDELKDVTDEFINENITAATAGLLNKTASKILEDINAVEERIKKQTGMTEEEWQARKPVFFTEKPVYNSITETAGTIDLLVVHSNGAMSMFDWKSMKFSSFHGEIIEDVDPSKRLGFDAQMLLYKKALIDETGSDNFGLVRIVPINVQLDEKGNIYKDKKEKQKLETFASNNSSTYLQPIPTTSEKTGIDELDASLERLMIQRENLQKHYSRNRKLKALIPKIQQIDRLIRDAQTKREFVIVSDAIDNLQRRFESKEVWSKSDSDELAAIKEELNLYKKFIEDAVSYLKSQKATREEMAKFEQMLGATIVLEKAIFNKTSEMFIKVKKPGVKVGWFSKIFNKLSDYQRGAFQELFSLVNSNYEYVREETNKIVDRLTEAVANLGMNPADAYRMMFNHKSGNLYVRTSNKFYEDRNKAREEKNIKWFLENTELQKVVNADGEVGYRYKGKALDAFNKSRKKHEEYLRDSTKTFSSQKERDKYVEDGLKAFDKKFDIRLNTGSIFEFASKYLYYNNNGKYDSEEWLAIQNNAGLKQYYDTYIDIIKELNNLDGVDVDDNFVASVHRSLLENMTYAGGFDLGAIKESLLHTVALQQHDEFGGYMSTDKDVDGRPIRRVPHLYTNDLTERLSSSERAEVVAKVDKEFDVNGWSKEGAEYELHVKREVEIAEKKKGLENKSMDLTRSLVLFAKASLTHSAFVRTEGAMKLLRFSLESDENQTIVTDWKGDYKTDKKDPQEVQTQKGVSEVEKSAFDDFADMHWYGNQGMSDSPMTIKIAGRDISIAKAANVFLKGSTMSAMGLKPLLAFGNLVGGKMNAWMKASEGIYFNQKQYGQSQLLEAKRDPMYAASVKFWEPSSHDLTLEKANKLSASKLTSWFTASNIYILHRLGTDSVSNNVLVSMLKNYGLSESGEVKRLAKLPEGSKSLFELQELTEEGIKIPGLKQAEYEKFRAIVRNQMTGIMGEMSEADKNLANSTMGLRYMMQFRNWMPGLIQTRFKSFSQSTIDEEYDVGRFRVLIGEFSNKGFAPVLKELGNLAMEVFMITKPNADPKVTEYYYKKYLMQNRLTKESLSLAEFQELRTAKLRGMVKEIRLYLAIILAMLAARAMIPDDKDDPMRQAAVVAYRMVARSYLEVGFFLDPFAMKNTLKSAIPQLTFVDKAGRTVRSIFEESYYGIVGDTRPKNKRPKPASYYLLKMFPGPSGTVIDLFDPYDSYKVGGGYIY